MGTLIILLALLSATLIGYCFILIGESKGDNPRVSYRKKYRILMSAYKDLHQEHDQLKKNYETLKTELIAHRNQLPWVNVKELDGTQE